jgi:hypothetical protein
MRTCYKTLMGFALLHFKTVYKIGIAILILSANRHIALGQSKRLHDELLAIKASNDSLNKLAPIEKTYLQFDKPYYASGDTIWFKAYLLNSFFTASDKSGIINIAITNDSNKVIKRYRISSQNGLGWGNIHLDEREGFIPGNYTIHAYTDWMRNFGQEYFFSKSFYIAGGGENGWLINNQVKEPTGNDDTVKVKLLLNDINKIPAANKTIRLQVMEGNKHLYKEIMQTDNKGLLDVNFKLPNKAGNLSIIAESIPAGKKAVIPVSLNIPQNIDVQFLPEGGYLVAGLTSHIGFKAIGEDGRGVDISGIITSHDKKQIAKFKSLRCGIGSFDLAVQNGENYTAKITLPGGIIKEYQLPVIKATGTVIRVKNLFQSDSLEVSVFATNAVASLGHSYFLIGKARGIICYAAIFNFNNGGIIKRKIAKSLFPAGITHFMVMTADKQPLDDRMIYIDHHDNFNIQLKTGGANYGPRDRVALKIKVTDTIGRSISGNFSLAVTDDSQVKTDTLNNGNILSQMLLASDLEGYVDQPGYYLLSKTAESWQALDNLLLTQGWVGYDWEHLFNPPAITYQPAYEFTVKGHVFNIFNKPVKKTNVLLFSKTPAILMDTITDKDGKFSFHHFPRVDTPIFVLKAVNKNGKSFNVGINIDDTEPPVFSKVHIPLILPWYINSDTTLLNYTKNNALLRQQEYFPAGGHMLKEVKILAKKTIKGSQNLNGAGGADIVIDEKDLEKALKKSWLQLLEEDVNGFREMDTLLHYPHWYYIHFQKVFFIIDGMLLNDMFQSLDFLSLKTYLQSHSAEDIKGIEIMSSAKYSAKYKGRFLSTELLMNIDYTQNDVAFVEITTRSGHGPVIDNTPGMYLYKPLPLSWPNQFYKPKYSVKDTVKHLPDLRSTIDWEPNISTNANGEAIVWFYAADMPSTYTIILEGSDMNGDLGYKRQKIVINNKGSNKGK